MDQGFQKNSNTYNLVEEKLGNNLELIGTVNCFFFNKTLIVRQ